MLGPWCLSSPCHKLRVVIHFPQACGVMAIDRTKSQSLTLPETRDVSIHGFLTEMSESVMQVSTDRVGGMNVSNPEVHMD